MTEKMRQLFAPPGPVVVHVIPPEIHPGGILLRFQDIPHHPCVCHHILFPGSLSGVNDNVSPSDERQGVWVRQVV